jgi:predicted alpha/beta superfamily hydrolase
MRHLLILVLLCCSIAIFASDFTIDTVKIYSNLLNEERFIIIYKPLNLDRSDSISILYMLDGEYSSYRYDMVSKENKENPIVGIGIINTNRNRDMLPVKQPDNFLKFIEVELKPKIETDSLIKQRILFGHSFAGGFTIFSMIYKPGLFDKYIASSPTPIMKMIDTTIYNQLDTKLEKQIKFYISYGSKDMGQVKKWSEKLNNNLLLLKLNYIIWKAEIFEGENHNTSDLHSLKSGLKY